MENDFTDAQVQQVSADAGQDTTQDQGTQEAAAEQQQDRVKNGIQTRIDELTRARHEAERRADEMTAMVARLSAQVAEQGRPVQHQEPGPELDPEQRKVLDAYFGPMMARMNAQMEQLGVVANMSRIHQEAPGEDPRVLSRAQQLLPAMLKAGWTPKDAVVYARGELYEQLAQGGGQVTPRAPNGRFVPPMQTQNGTPPQLTGPGPQALPANFDRLPPDKQIEILEKRGVHNQPLFNGDQDY